MNSSESESDQTSADRQRPHETAASLSKFKKFMVLYWLPFLIVIIAVIFSITSTNYYKIHYLRYTWLFPQTLSKFINPTQNRTPISNSPYCVLWMAPFLSGGGYSSESWSYILALRENLKKPGFKLAIEQHGDLESLEFWLGVPQHVKDFAVELYKTKCRINETIVVCHSEPGAWNPPLFETSPCPPSAYQNFKSVIGRTMFETDRVNADHVQRCNRMDYVWVPTEFHVSTFIKSGVDPSKVVKIVQPIDVNFFDPHKYVKPLNLASLGALVLGTYQPRHIVKTAFKLLSIFKWEHRKGWDLLLKAYLKEFSMADGVAMFLLTNPYHTDSDFGNKILEFVEDSKMEEPTDGWAPIYVIDKHVAQTDLPRVYKAADAFVLPSRGEGWGRPIVEAMAMQLPVIATNWSGPTEYLSKDNSFPLPLDRLSEVTEGPFKGHLWAEPSGDELQVLMRHVKNNIREARAKGRQARQNMIDRFSPGIVADIVAKHVQKIIHHNLDS